MQEFSRQLESCDLDMVIHGSYTINLAHPIDSYKFKASAKSLINDLHTSAIIGPRCIGVIIHMGKNIPANNLTDQDAIDNYVVGLRHCIEHSPMNTTIILETGASQGTEIASTTEKMAYIYSKLTATEQKRVKFCIDTCHIWSSGYDISTRKGAVHYLTEFKRYIGVDKIACIHLNDSKTPINSHVDRHADIGYGKIGIEGLKYITQWSIKHKIPIVMETPLSAVNPDTNKDITHLEQMKLILSWIKK